MGEKSRQLVEHFPALAVAECVEWIVSLGAPTESGAGGELLELCLEFLECVSGVAVHAEGCAVDSPPFETSRSMTDGSAAYWLQR